MDQSFRKGEVRCLMKVSTIIPVYNGEDTIICALESVLAQSFPVYEIIVVNDGSVDGTKAVIEKFIETTRIFNIVVHHVENGGPSKARNIGIKYAEGDLIAFLDADDVWHSDKLYYQVKMLNCNRDLKLLSTSIGMLEKKPLNCSRKEQPVYFVTFNKLLFHNYFSTSGVVVYRDVFLATGGFEESQSHSEDYMVWLTIARNHKTGVLKLPLVYYGGGKSYFGGEGLSGNLYKMFSGEIQNYKRLYKNHYIGFTQFTIIVMYAYVKFLRRLLLVLARKTYE